MMANKSVILSAVLAAAMLAACTDDDTFTTSPSNLLTFSTDTIRMDTVFSTVPTSTRTFWVYNRSGDGIRCTNVRLVNGNQTGFRVNVDGEYLSPTAGYQVHDVELRNKDSLRVFVELTSPVNGEEGPRLLEDDLEFTLESGARQRVNLNAYTWDATLLRDMVVSRDTTLGGTARPIVVYGGIKVDSLVTLRLAAGTTLYFHADAGLDVYGTLVAEGAPGAEVVLRGDRTDRMFDYLPYDMVSGQWQGIRLHSSSYDNTLEYTDVHGTFDGIVCDSSDVTRPKLNLYSSTVHNCQGYGLMAVASRVEARNCQITNTLHDCVAVFGGDVSLTHCTLAQFYPFDSARGAALRFANHSGGWPCPLVRMDCLNSIVTGYADHMMAGERLDGDDAAAFNYRFAGTLLRDSTVVDDEHFVDMIWEDVADEDRDTSIVEGEENFRLVDIDTQHYDFHLAEGSPAIGAAMKDYALPDDRDGLPRDEEPDMGCYEYVKEE